MKIFFYSINYFLKKYGFSVFFAIIGAHQLIITFFDLKQFTILKLSISLFPFEYVPTYGNFKSQSISALLSVVFLSLSGYTFFKKGRSN